MAEGWIVRTTQHGPSHHLTTWYFGAGPGSWVTPSGVAKPYTTRASAMRLLLKDESDTDGHTRKLSPTRARYETGNITIDYEILPQLEAVVLYG